MLPRERRGIDELVRARPELWAKCYPKIYQGLDGGEYYSAKLVGHFMLMAALKMEFPEMHQFRRLNETDVATWASRLAAYRVPIFWLSREITEALQLTTLPATLNLTTMNLPFEAAVFMLPKGSLIFESDKAIGEAFRRRDSEVVYVSYSRVAKGEEIPSINLAAVEAVRGRGEFTVFAGTLDRRLVHWSHPSEQSLDIAQLDATVQNTLNSPQAEEFEEDLTPHSRPFLARVSHLVFNTLQLMLSRPNLVSMGSLVKRVHNKRKSIKTFWTPNIIGKDYRLRRESQPLGGTHASPRGHWVRGFWRDQACGPNFSEHKETWIEPFWRGGE